MSRRSGKKADTKAVGEMVTPSHGKGMIWRGAPANPVAGTGRPPSAIREQLRGSFVERIGTLEKIADSGDFEPSDRIRAIDLLAKYGLGTTKEVSVEQVREKVAATVRVIQRCVPADQLVGVLAELRQVWA